MPAQQTPTPAVSKPSSTPVDYSSLDYTGPGETLSADSSGANGDTVVNYDDVPPEELAAGGVATDSTADATSDNTNVNKPQVVQPVNSAADDNDDDDEDDDDDLDVGLEEDDDDEDEEDDDDDDDDEDDIEDVVGDDIIEAKRSRESSENNNLVR